MKKLFFLSFIILLCSCGEQNASSEAVKPDSLLSKEQMVDFLIDINILEARLKNMALPHDSCVVLFDHFEKELYHEHGFTDSVYRQSYRYYVAQPADLKAIYDAVSDSLILRQEALSPNEENSEQK